MPGARGEGGAGPVPGGAGEPYLLYDGAVRSGGRKSVLIKIAGTLIWKV